MRKPLVASIGSTHPWNIAGVGLDARVAAELGVDHAAAIAGVTAQDESGLRATFAVPSETLRAQLDTVATADAFRVGALLDAQNVRTVAAFLREHARAKPVVLDPVFGATLGGAFADAATYDAMREALFVLPVILTPNWDEAQRITNRPVNSQEAALDAARALLELGPAAVFLKGGHSPGDPLDVLMTGDEVHVFKDARLPGSMRGSGCVVAMGLACDLALGKPLVEAVEAARRYVRAKIGANRRRGSLQVAF